MAKGLHLAGHGGKALNETSLFWSCRAGSHPTLPFEKEATSERSPWQVNSQRADGLTTVSRRIEDWLDSGGVPRVRCRAQARSMRLMKPKYVVYRDPSGRTSRFEGPCPVSFQPKMPLSGDRGQAPILAGQRPVGPMEVARRGPAQHGDEGPAYGLLVGTDPMFKPRANTARGIGMAQAWAPPQKAPPFCLVRGPFGPPAVPRRLIDIEQDNAHA